MKLIEQRLTIVKHPNVTLREHNVQIENPKEYMDLAQKMIHTMRVHHGLGLAAPQIAQNIQMFVALIDRQPIVVFNPEILQKADTTISIEEGCLSLENYKRSIIRAEWIEMKYNDIRGRQHIKRIGGLNAIVCQHEIDHLNGILICD